MLISNCNYCILHTAILNTKARHTPYAVRHILLQVPQILSASTVHIAQFSFVSLPLYSIPLISNRLPFIHIPEPSSLHLPFVPSSFYRIVLHFVFVKNSNTSFSVEFMNYRHSKSDFENLLSTCVFRLVHIFFSLSSSSKWVR